MSRRPKTFSYAQTLRYKEMQLLLVLSVLIQSSCYISLDIDKPYKDGDERFPLEFYTGGAACGLVVLAIWSDCLIKQHMLFLPIVAINTL